MEKECINDQISNLLKEEGELQFNQFNSETALEIGMEFVRIAKEENKAIAIDIWRNGQQLFRYACEGTSSDNDAWLVRKRNTVNRFGKNSLIMGLKLKAEGKTLQEKYGINPSEYSTHGGDIRFE